MCQPSLDQINFKELENKIFFKKGDSFYLGGLEVSDQMRGLLKDQAELFLKSELFEVLESTITNEASNLLLQAGNMEHLQYGKALHYWNKILKKIIIDISK